MSDYDYIGIKGWSAIVNTISIEKTKGDVDYVVGSMSLLPTREGRDVVLSGEDMCLDVFFHCYTPEIASKFFKEIKVNDSLIVSGDLSHRYWDLNDKGSNTNFWLDDYLIDSSKGKVSSLSSVLYSSSPQEYEEATFLRYDDICCFCNNEMSQMAESYSERKYCSSCDD